MLRARNRRAEGWALDVVAPRVASEGHKNRDVDGALVPLSGRKRTVEGVS